MFRFKDETAGDPIIQFCGLRSKCYSMVTATTQKLAAAGVTRSQHKLLKHERYVNTLADSTVYTVDQRTFVSKNHTVFTQQTVKTALSIFDIKRVVLPDGIRTVPHGYFELRRNL